MAEFTGEIFRPEEGTTGIPEELSEEAKQRFTQAAQALQQLQREERKSKKKDDQLARAIIQFLQDPRHERFFVLICKLVSRNCPSIFILGILSLINEDCLRAVQEYFTEHQEPDASEMVETILSGRTTEEEPSGKSLTLLRGKELTERTNRTLIDWITRLQMILAHETERILQSLLIDDRHLDGSVLQLTIFVLQEFFLKEGKELPYEKARPLTASILQTVFEPFVGAAHKKALEASEKAEEET
jgi:hypothetical protein